MMTTNHAHNGQAHRPGPLESAARGETRLIEQLDAMAERLDLLGTDELLQAQNRLANSAALLSDRLAQAREFVQGTLSRTANLLAGMADLFSDDITKADEVTPPPMSPSEWDSQIPPLARMAARAPTAQEAARHAEIKQAIAEAPPAQHGPPDDEDDPNDDLPTEDDEHCPRGLDEGGSPEEEAEQLALVDEMNEIAEEETRRLTRAAMRQELKEARDVIAREGLQPPKGAPTPRKTRRKGRKS